MCVASSSSVRNTLPGHAMYTGRSRSSSVRAWTGDVCVRSTRPGLVHEERVLHLPRRVVDAEVQRVEVEPLRLELGPLGDLPAHRDEDVGDALGQRLQRVPRAARVPVGGQRDVDGLLDEDALRRARPRARPAARPARGARRPLAWPSSLPAVALSAGARPPMARLASAIGLRSPTCSRRADFRASRSAAAARALSAASTADSMPSASSGDRAVSSDILTFQCGSGRPAREGARPWPGARGAPASGQV